MLKNKKIISILSIILCIVFFSFSTLATETSENTGSETSMSEFEPEELSSEQESMEQISESSGNTDESEEGEWSNETDPTTDEFGDDPAEEDETQPISETEPIEEPEDYVSSDEIETIDVTGDVDTNTLTDNDWEQIGLELELKEDNGEDIIDDNGDDFSFIKDNDDKQNNGTWIIVLGIALVVCAACSLLAVIVLTQKIEYVKKIPVRQRGNVKPADDYGDNYSGNKNNSYRGKH